MRLSIVTLRYYRMFLLLFLAPLSFSAQQIPFPDVPPNTWYEGAVQNFLQQGYLDPEQPRFRPADRASRAEFIKLIVLLNGGILDELPDLSRFSDVPSNAWFFGYIEEAAREGWVKGDAECAGAARCFVRPLDPLSRAEAAQLIKRAFGKKGLMKAPAFSDNPPGSWYSEAIQIAADHCFLHGDDGTRNVRPADPMNRAEMVVLLSRIDEGKKYPEC